MTTYDITNKKDIQEKENKNVPFEDHPFTKMMELLLSPDPNTIYRINTEKRQDAKKWGFV